MKMARARRWRLLRNVGLTVVVLIVLALGLPYLVFRAAPTQLPATQEGSGTLIYVVGWDGPVRRDREMLQALREAGCPMEMETFDWTGGFKGMMAFWLAQASQRPAARLSERIQSVRREHPDQPIYLIADSSGCAIALKAMEKLPPQVMIKTVILTSAAVAPKYDLGPALQHVQGRMISFNSDRDFVILWLGSTIFGTVDGHHTPAAGRVGFVSRPDQSGYEKLLQIPYDPAWKAQFGNAGGHGQALGSRFAKAMIAPLLRD
jgi:pimeloyl-ACP methyl ester carboxylesterase